jgi:RNA 3'-phosphate cyclase
LKNPQLLEIDGSFGEGGGAIIRLSAAFSILYDQPIKIINIRANRPKPGLRTQHLLGLKSLAHLTNSNLSSSDVGTEEITFIPNTKSIKEKIEIHINTAASLGLLLQPLQLACLKFKKPEKVYINLIGGGTFGKWAPSLNYLSNVTYQIFRNSGIKFDIKIINYGFYPKGNANTQCTITLPHSRLSPINLTTLGQIKDIYGEIVISNKIKNRDIPSRIKNEIKSIIIRKIPEINTTIDVIWAESLSPGVSLCLWANSDNDAVISSGTILGEKQISSEKLANIATFQILKYIQNKIPVDNYLSDQLIPIMGYISTPSRIRVLEVTQHTKTNLDLVKLFTNREYKISRDGNSFIIEFNS